MTAKEQGLPALPEPFGSLERTGMWNGSMREGRDDVYDADQMRAYALSALASDTGERGKVVGWWNGQRGEMLDGEPSIRWGANAENTWHDIPLYAGPNPIHALRAQPAGGGEDWQARALAAEADIERMTDAFNRENGPTFMGEPVLPPEKMVELEPGVRVPKWLLDDTRRVELYMKAHLPGSWRIGGIQSHDYANPTPPESGGQGEARCAECYAQLQEAAWRKVYEPDDYEDAFPKPAIAALGDGNAAEVEFLNEWLYFAAAPGGLECCGRWRGRECCGDLAPVYRDPEQVIAAMAERHRELTAPHKPKDSDT